MTNTIYYHSVDRSDNESVSSSSSSRQTSEIGEESVVNVEAPSLYSVIGKACLACARPATDNYSTISEFSEETKELATGEELQRRKLTIFWNLGYLGHKKLQNDELEGEELKKRKLTFQHILEATQNFSSKMEIGRGGSGTVYKAVLRDGLPLAVKKLIARSIKGLGEYINEVKKLQSLKNENIAQLLGWYAGSGQLLLIFEYMEMNSLHKALFGDTKSIKVLSWNSRYNICLQIAKGLVYLHEDSEPKIIHRDINPSNILLDAKINAKISDFGLAKFYNEEQGTAVTTLCGTHGYMAPEYAFRGILSEKTDVYSYGILILEIATGKSNATYKSNKESDFLFDEVSRFPNIRKREQKIIGFNDKLSSYYDVAGVPVMEKWDWEHSSIG